LELQDADILDLQNKLLEWFKSNGRDLPWRQTANPFHILLAEKLLQQTRAQPVVIEAYVELVRRYPNPQALACADIVEIEGIIQQLGLHYRAQEMVRLAQEIVLRFGGNVPRTLDDLLDLPGVGDYTGRAVLSFAFGDDVPIVDTNVARFLYRLYGIRGSLPSNPARRKSLLELAARLIPQGYSRDFNLAVLDLCAELCKPRTPLCKECPVSIYCSFCTRVSVSP